ncbi:hypothetical protein [Saccharibacillus alkalitolerans]|uniref:SbsC C-terminal domain-containing protein n=1 Tax=Saccharibacillus alkalitolerans TaxID=2705290 RepID=A0ABX0EZD4_9BACL|nr:hypothetical protein [Saccharibacillus alkalitolerans]NGZ74107.1 hypothetical protein [Saccharibacillus alkalitolerans]
MEKQQPNKRSRWPIAVLATAIAAGGVYALPHVFAGESSDQQAKSASAAGNASAVAKTSPSPHVSASSAVAPSNSQAASAVIPVSTASASKKGDAVVVQPVLSADPKKSSAAASRSALIKLEIMSLKAEAQFPLDPSEKQYVKLIDARNRAVEVSSDSNAPADRVFSTSRKLEEALDRYNDAAVGSADAVKKTLAGQLNETMNGRAENALNAAELLMLQGIKEAQSKLSANSTKDGALSAYKQFLMRASESNDIAPFRASDYTNALKQYEANIEARSQGVGAGKVGDLRKAYDTSAKALETAIAGASGKNVLDAAKSSVETTYAALTEGLALAEAIQAAEPLLDSPAGKEKGQYGASKIGTLRREIGKADRALETSKTAEQLTNARTALARAVSDFKNSRNA